MALGSSPPDFPIKVLLAKLGLDGHDRGVKVVARSLGKGAGEEIGFGGHLRP